MSENIKVAGALVFPEGAPTRAGEIVNSIDEILNIPAPRVGMIVYVKSTKLNYIVRSLKKKEIDGVLVDNAQVDEYEQYDIIAEVTRAKAAEKANADAITAEKERAETAEAALGEAIGGVYDMLAEEDEAIRKDAMNYKTLSASHYADKVVISGDSLKAIKRTADILAATSEKAGVMSAEDKRNLQALENKTATLSAGQTKQQAQINNIRPVVYTNSNIVNAPDEEDLTTTDNSLKFKDRKPLDGMGYVILRKSQTFEEQVLENNTIYEIRYDFTIGKDFKLPDNCVLQFVGGSINSENNTLNLNGAKVYGDGLRCPINNPAGGCIYTSQVGISGGNASGTDAQASYNANMLESLVKKNIKVIFNTNAVFSRAIESHYYSIDSVGHRVLKFPNSAGLTYVGGSYSAHNEIRNINIVSLGDCINFCALEQQDRPNNIYFSEFANLTLQSLEGYGLYAGDCRGKEGDQLVFNCTFDNINVNSGKSGFFGIKGIQNSFTHVTGGYCNTAIFENCAGRFEDFNGTFGADGNFTPTFFKARGEQRLQCEFNKCNFEDFAGIIFDCNDSLVYCHFTISNCYIYISKDTNAVVNKCPFQFHYLYNLTWYNNIIYHAGKYASNVQLISIYDYNQTKYIGDTTLGIISGGVYNITLESVPASRKSAVLVPAEYGTKFFPYLTGLYVDRLHIKSLHTPIVKRNINTDGSIELWDAKAVGCVVDNDVDGKTNINYFVSISPYSRIYESVVISNSNKNRTLVIKNGLNYAYNFKCESGKDVEIPPGGCVEAVLDIKASATTGTCIIKEKETFKKKTGSSSERPQGVEAGFGYYDTELSIPIWWDGTAWRNANGELLES